MKKILLLLAFGIVLNDADAEPVRWWNPKWNCRREVEVKAPKPKYEGEEVGYVEFWTGGILKPDGGDLRVVAQGKPVPHKIIEIGPGDYCKVSFAAAAGVETYDIYYGNPSANAEDSKWEPKRGLLLEVRQYRGPGFQNWAQMTESLDRAKSLVMGRGYVPNVFLGYNPFGETKNCLSMYTGWLAIPSQGDYVFATTSDDASFLLVDNQLVVAWGGTHRAAPFAAQFEVVKAMRPGLHKFAYYHAQAIDMSAAVAAWLPAWRLKDLPDGRRKDRKEWLKENRFEVIPASAFPPVTKGVLKDHRIRGSTLSPDFEVKNVGEVQVGEGYMQRIRFSDATPTVKGHAVVTQRWDFGDGNTALGSPVEHVYLCDGDYKVTLDLATAAHHFSVAQTVHVTRDWERQIKPSSDNAADCLPMVEKYDFANMPPAHLVAASRYFEEMGKTDMVIRLCRQVLSKKDSDAPVDARYELAMLLGKSASDAETAQAAIEAFHDVESRTRDMRQQAALALAAGEASLNVIRNPEIAEKEFRRVATTYASADRDLLRQAFVGLGDVYREKADYKKAKECYDKAAEIPTSVKEYRKTAVQVGAYSRAVDMYLREGKLDNAEDFLDEWEWEFPAERLQGYSTWLRAKLLIARGDHRSAARLLDKLVLVNPGSPYAAECLLLAAECYGKLGDRKKAVAVLRQIVSEYKDSPLNADAAKKLKDMGE